MTTPFEKCLLAVNSPPVAIVYHFGCSDGITALAIMEVYLEQNHPQIKKESFCGIYQRHVDIELFRGKDVYLLDFSYPLETLKKIIDVAFNVTVIDHHKTAIENLDPIKDQFINKLDINHCAAYLTWKFLYPDLDVPYFIDLVNARDMWLKDNKDADYFNMAFITENGYECAKLNTMKALVLKCLTDHSDIAIAKEMVTKGQNYKRCYDHLCKQIAKNSYDTTITDHDGKILNVLMVNCHGQFASDVGALVANRSPSGIAITWHATDTKTKFSVRVKAGVNWDAGKYAAPYSGGGHPASAGYSVAH